MSKTTDKSDENYIYNFVGKNVAKYRKQKGLTQKQLAEKSFYNTQFISNIESDTHQTFSLGTIYKLAKCLDIPVYYLLIEEDDKILETLDL